jgi:thymidylate synthase
MQQYLDLLADVRDNGRFRPDRTGVGAYGVFGRQLRFDLSKGFPLLTTKKLFTRGIIAELLWFLAGDTNEHTLRDQKVGIWKEWAPKGPELNVYERLQWLNESNREAYMAAVRTESTQRIKGESHEDFRNRDIEADIAHYTPILDAAGVPTHAPGDGDLGRIYGAQWRNWKAVRPTVTGTDEPPYDIIRVDQITNLIRDLKTNPNSRRHIVTAWNPGELDQMALPPCHCLFQFYTEELTTGERETLFRDARVSNVCYEEYKCLDPWLLPGFFSENSIPKYRLSLQLYQRSQMSALAA